MVGPAGVSRPTTEACSPKTPQSVQRERRWRTCDSQTTSSVPRLASLLLDHGDEGIGPVDFRSLSVREFGTIYEGLLGVASCRSRRQPRRQDHAQGRGRAVCSRLGWRRDLHVQADEVYLEGVSGRRKATGSYFTKPFCVEHLLDEALEPALDAHIERLAELRSAGDEAAAAEAFFDFRCADIAMGSGHFLVAALDRIEARLSGWLADNPLPPVSAELDRLRSAALAALGDLAAGVEIESSSLLRRQVARRCVYGVDLNPVAVELARLAVVGSHLRARAAAVVPGPQPHSPATASPE